MPYLSYFIDLKKNNLIQILIDIPVSKQFCSKEGKTFVGMSSNGTFFAVRELWCGDLSCGHVCSSK